MALRRCLLVCIAVLLGTNALRAQAPDILRKLLEDKHAEAGADFWVYNDLEKAMAVARKENKPLFVTFRCVPCRACSGFDGLVAKGSGSIEKLARKEFISVRQVEMKGVDLSLFQFDHDLNWAAMFVNADGVVYARYGTQSAKGPDAYNSVEGLENTMKRVLKLHAGFPKNRSELEDKRSKKKSYDAFDLPGLDKKDKLRAPTRPNNCIHCHMIHDAQNITAEKKKKPRDSWLWRYPLPDNLGLTINPVDGRTIESVGKNSPASRASFQKGDEITHMEGQAIASIADMQWVLHNLPNTKTTVEVTGKKAGKRSIQLDKGWKKSDISWRGSLWSLEPKLRVWAPPLNKEQREKHGIAAEKTAFLVKWINRGSKGGKSAYNSGLRQGDVIIKLEGKPIPDDMTPSAFNLHIKLSYKIGDELPVTVLRNGRNKDIKLKLVE